MFGAAKGVGGREEEIKIYNLVSVIYMDGPNFDLSSNLIWTDV
jgi:hypothetical protein